MQLLIESHDETFDPNHLFDWGLMVETLAEAGTLIASLQNLLDVQQTFYTDDNFNLDEVVIQLSKVDNNDLINMMLGWHQFISRTSNRWRWFIQWNDVCVTSYVHPWLAGCHPP